MLRGQKHIIFGLACVAMFVGGTSRAWALDIELVRNCLKGLTIAEARQQVAGGNLGSITTPCDHSRLLREGVSIHAVHELYQEMRVLEAEELFKEKGKSESVVEHMTVDGTCMVQDWQDAATNPTKAADACLARLKRFKADAMLRARQEITESNQARLDLIDRPGNTPTAQLLAGDKRLESVQAVINGQAPEPKDRIIKDINVIANGPSKLPPQLAQQKAREREEILTPQHMLARPQLVSFGDEPVDQASTDTVGESLREGSTTGIQGVKTEDVANINAEVAATMTNGSTLEVQDTNAASQPVDINSALRRLRPRLTQALDADQKALAESEKYLTSPKTTKPQPLSGVKLISELALVEAVNAVVTAAKKEKQGRNSNVVLGNDVVNEFDVQLPITPAGAPNAGSRRKPANGATDPKIGLDDRLDDTVTDIEADLPPVAPPDGR